MSSVVCRRSDPQLLRATDCLHSPSANGRMRSPDRSLLPTHPFLRQLLNSSLVLEEDWYGLPRSAQEEFGHGDDRTAVLSKLVRHKLLTEYQAARVEAGTVFGLTLGNYRVLDRLGSGGMGVVFLAEHVQLRGRVAVKVLPVRHEEDSHTAIRFLAEMRAVARLCHPNIVGAIDAGRVPAPQDGSPDLHYFVMEYVPGQDLEEHVERHGPLDVHRACDVIHQVASALAEADRHGLVHRDIKPSNVHVTPEGQAKLLDFGLVRQFGSRLTEPGAVLGTFDYVAPEQARDASTVDIRADLYALGGTLCWCLTGRTPFPPGAGAAETLIARLTQQPPSVRTWRPDLPAELDALVARLMAVHPDDRYQTPEAVMRALLPFLRSGAEDVLPGAGPAAAAAYSAPPQGRAAPGSPQVLITDDELHIRAVCRCALQSEGVHCDEAATGARALEAAGAKPYDLILLDVDMPELDGLETLRRLRRAPPNPNLKVVMISGRATPDEMAHMLSEGADDYLSKPFTAIQLTNRVKSALRLKAAQDRAESLNRHLLTLNAELEHGLAAKDSDLIHARNALVVALASVVEHRTTETEGHLLRMQHYCRCLAEEAAGTPPFAPRIDANFIRMLESAVPLHDIGTVGLPDHILQKAGKLDADERIVMQSHTVIGAETLHKVARKHGSGVTFLQTAIDIARHHHERYDGAGYPDRLVGDDIPLAARVAAVADVYDALRCRRPYKPALSHPAALQLMVETCQGQFDPQLLEVFQHAAPRFERIFRDVTD